MSLFPDIHRAEAHPSRSDIAELLQQISKTMPVDTPGSLTASNYVDVIAYILQVNNFPAGAQELSTGSDVLGGVLIEVNRPGISK